MTEHEFEIAASRFDSAMRHVEEAIAKLAELERIKGIDVSHLSDRLYDIGCEIELELDALEVEFDE